MRHANLSRREFCAIAGSVIGYDVTFREFDGDHEIPADVAREGLKWIVST
ncbi:MAG TPA: hypothetical protein VJP89_06515 [Pyrinomonadaceae bacterium]|nr:hypothetical protein [Pyrinomonadaceae bacterium]